MVNYQPVMRGGITDGNAPPHYRFPLFFVLKPAPVLALFSPHTPL